MALFGFLGRRKESETVEKTYTTTDNRTHLNRAFTPSEEQLRVFNLLDSSGDNYFVTGRAGTGKSSQLRYFAENTSKKCVIVL